MSKVTPETLKSKIVFDKDGNKAGLILGIVRDKYEKITVDFIEIELDKKINWGARTKVLVRTRDAQLRDDGNINVKYSKDQLKVMSKEQELQRHPPTI
ncbi:MAG: hypothetical protein ACTSPT_01630 [Candidatus Heimdallarchaeota archaeon]